MKNKDYLITDNPFKALFIFFLPLMLGNVFQQFYNLIDSAILGRFVSEQALAAAGACLALTNVFIFIASGGGIGAAVVIGNYFGAKNYKKMKTVITSAYISFFILSIILGALGFILGHKFMEWLKTPEDTIELAVIYLRIYFLGLPFIFLYNITSSMYNALGKSKFPLLFLIISSLTNIGLDILFVTKYSFGIKGVAYATLIAQGLACILSIIVFIIEIKKMNIGKAQIFSNIELGRITKIALPSILQQATISIGLMLIQSTVNSFGSNALAGFSAGARIEAIAGTIMVSGGTALSTFVAQNLGAGKLHRIRQGYFCANIIQIIFAFLFFITIQIFNKEIIYAFIGNDCSQDAFNTAFAFLDYMSMVLVIMGFKHTADGVLRGLGRMTMFTVANIINIVIRVAYAKIMAPISGISAVWVSNPIGWIVSLILCYSSYRVARKQMNF